MQRIDLHSHAIPEAIVAAMRDDPVYDTRVGAARSNLPGGNP